jgi:hypothetical protein
MPPINRLETRNDFTGIKCTDSRCGVCVCAISGAPAIGDCFLLSYHPPPPPHPSRLCHSECVRAMIIVMLSLLHTSSYLARFICLGCYVAAARGHCMIDPLVRRTTNEKVFVSYKCLKIKEHVLSHACQQNLCLADAILFASCFRRAAPVLLLCNENEGRTFLREGDCR